MTALQVLQVLRRELVHCHSRGKKKGVDEKLAPSRGCAPPLGETQSADYPSETRVMALRVPATAVCAPPHPPRQG